MCRITIHRPPYLSVKIITKECFYHADDVYVYKLVMIMSLIVAGLTSLILLLLIICFNVSWRVEKQGQSSNDVNNLNK